MGRSPRQAWVRDRLLLLLEFFWIGGIVLEILGGMIRAWRLLYAGRQADAFWTIVHLGVPYAIAGAFFYSVYLAASKVVLPFARRRYPEREWPDIAWRWPWQPRRDDA